VVRPALTLAAILAFLEVAGIPLARQALALTVAAPFRRRPFAAAPTPPFRPTPRREPGTTLRVRGPRVVANGPFGLALAGVRGDVYTTLGAWHHPLLVAREFSTTLCWWRGSPAPPFRPQFRPSRS
jgi:hypothetical protein